MENSEWYTEALKEGIRQAEEKSKESGCKDEEPKKSSGRYPWSDIPPRKTYAAWAGEALVNNDRLGHFTAEEIHPYLDIMLKANIADELHRIKDILIKMERKK